jgi:serine/threonine protein kinase
LEIASNKYPIYLKDYTTWEFLDFYSNNKNLEECLSSITYISEDFEEFVKLCLKYNPSERPNIKELLNHPFILKYFEENLNFY